MEINTVNNQPRYAENGEKNTERAYYSEEVQEVLNRMPPWLERSGNLLLLALLVICLILAYLIRYPDVITVTAKITEDRPPSTGLAPVSGAVGQILTPDQTSVKGGAAVLTLTDSAGLLHTLTAPASGPLYYLRLLRPGDPLQAGMPLFTIAATQSAVSVNAYVPARYFSQVKPGQRIVIRRTIPLPGESQTMEGYVRQKSTILTSDGFEVQVQIDGDFRSILPSEPLEIMIVLENYRLIERIIHLKKIGS